MLHFPPGEARVTGSRPTASVGALRRYHGDVSMQQRGKKVESVSDALVDAALVKLTPIFE
ncbi:MAG TPA: hypothetical protein VNX70_13120 [Bryobacteraceae bacterium]|nr:hypothetical protein [Bryobacteraceae bacterium]